MVLVRMDISFNKCTHLFNCNNGLDCGSILGPA